MDALRKIIYLRKWQIDIRKHINLLFLLTILSMVFTSCKDDPHTSNWFEEETLTICQYLDINQEEYSKSYSLLSETKMLNTLCGYNPYGDGYTLFLPNDEAIENFIRQNQDYNNFEEMLLDTSFTYSFVRYHIVKRRLHSDNFPDGGLMDSTLNGERLTCAFYSEGDNQIIKINKEASIVKSNIKMTNGFIHVISKVLEQNETSGYDLFQQQEGFSILAEAMEISGIKRQLWWNKYTILAEHDSIYNRNGIFTVQDLIKRVATPGKKLTDKLNSFYRFVGYHFVGGEYYINDFNWGKKDYATMASKPLSISVSNVVKINPGVEIFDYEVTESGDTLEINYILPVWNNSNIMTATGPIHTISDLLFYEPFPE